MTAIQPRDLSARDAQILRDLARVRLLTGGQLERLHFHTLATANARGSARRRALNRLSRLHLVTTVPRRVGGVRAGSAGLVYTLDARAQRTRALWDPASLAAAGSRTRRPWAIGWPFVQHTLDVAELYVQTRERERAGQLRMMRYDAEPASWFPSTVGTVKPDAFLIVEADGWEQHWWLEVDRATESIPTVRRKLSRYLRLYEQGSAGPAGVLPTVLLTAPDARRRDQLMALLRQLRVPDGFMSVATFDRAMEHLPGSQARPPP